MEGVQLECSGTLVPLHLGGRFQKTGDDHFLMRSGPGRFTLCSSEMERVSALCPAQEDRDEEEEENDVLAFAAIDKDSMATVNRMNLIEIWSLSENLVTKSWKAHASPITVMAHARASRIPFPLLATGSADHAVRLWDSETGDCTHHLRGAHGAMPCLLHFISFAGQIWLMTGAEDGSLALWDLKANGKLVAAVKPGAQHSSAITAIDHTVFENELHVLSASRDQTVCLWKATSKGLTLRCSMAMGQSVETALFVQGLQFVCGGSTLELWDGSAQRKMAQTVLAGRDHQVQHVELTGSTLMASTSEQLFFQLDLQLQVKNVFAGHHGEITDMALINDELMAISTNAPEVRLIDASLLSSACQLLRGHSQPVVALASCKSGLGPVLISGSRDHTARLWLSPLDKEAASIEITGHTDVVSAVAIAPLKEILLAATASADLTIKTWTVNPEGSLKAKWTVKAHDKDINSLVISPNGRYLVSCSQDKTAKLWSLSEGSLLGVCTGHRRGVWAAAFSPVEQLLATASSDRTIKLWSLPTKSEKPKCLRTLESEQSAAIIRLLFSRSGQQIVAATADGLLRTFDVKSGASSVLDAHPDRIWAMLSLDDSLWTGDASGTLKRWRNVSQERAIEQQQARDAEILAAQLLSNLILKKDYSNAAVLAIQQQQPHRLFSLFTQLIAGHDIETSLSLLSPIVSALTDPQAVAVLTWLRDWNVSLKRAHVSQLVLAALLREKRQAISKSEALTQILPYGQRHAQKLDEMLIRTYLADLIIDKIL